MCRGNTVESNTADGIAVFGEGSYARINSNLCIANVAGLRVYEDAQAEAQLNIVANNSRGMCGGRVRNAPPGRILNKGYNCVWQNIKSDYDLCDPNPTDILRDPMLSRTKKGRYELHPDSPCLEAGPKGENIGGLKIAQPEASETGE